MFIYNDGLLLSILSSLYHCVFNWFHFKKYYFYTVIRVSASHTSLLPSTSLQPSRYYKPTPHTHVHLHEQHSVLSLCAIVCTLQDQSSGAQSLISRWTCRSGRCLRF